MAKVVDYYISKAKDPINGSVPPAGDPERKNKQSQKAFAKTVVGSHVR